MYIYRLNVLSAYGIYAYAREDFGAEMVERKSREMADRVGRFDGLAVWEDV